MSCFFPWKMGSWLFSEIFMEWAGLASHNEGGYFVASESVPPFEPFRQNNLEDIYESFLSLRLLFNFSESLYEWKDTLFLTLKVAKRQKYEMGLIKETASGYRSLACELTFNRIFTCLFFRLNHNKMIESGKEIQFSTL